MVTCPRCGTSRGDSDRFCADCGAPLGRADVLGVGFESLRCARPLAAGVAFAAAVAGLRRHFTPCHLAHGLLDRAADLLPAEPRIRAPMVTAPGPEETATARDG